MSGQYKFVKRVNGVAVLCTEWSVPDSTSEFNLRHLQLMEAHAKHLGVTWEKVDVGEQIEVKPLFKDTKMWFGKLMTGHEPIRVKPSKTKRMVEKPVQFVPSHTTVDIDELVSLVLNKENK